MDFIQRCFQGKIFLFALICLLCFTNAFSFFYFLNQEEKTDACICEECSQTSLEEEKNYSKIKVDLKGYVKKPGVYEVENETIVNDLIKLAGGLKTNATTENINLSKKLKDEDVVIILSKTELKKQQQSSTVLPTGSTSTNVKPESSAPTTSTSVENANRKVCLNTASKEELMTLTGIGESKALAIIEYRNNTSFKDITEIMNVSGIGESVYEKIKDFITV